MALAVLLGCGGGVGEQPGPRELPGRQWCVSMNVRGQPVVACTQHLSFCLEARSSIKRRGGLVGVRTVSDCRRVVTR